MNELKDLVQYALDQDYNKASEVFGNAMSIKIQDVLDQEKVKLANQIYNGVEEDEEDEELAAMSDEEIDAELEGAEELDDEDAGVDESEEDEEDEEK